MSWDARIHDDDEGGQRTREYDALWDQLDPDYLELRELAGGQWQVINSQTGEATAATIGDPFDFQQPGGVPRPVDREWAEFELETLKANLRDMPRP